MTPPTVQEIAGIFMLALLAAGLIAHPSTGSHAASAPMAAAAAAAPAYATPVPIDGIEDFALPVRGEAAKPGLSKRSK
jgi:hypothetical protein